VFTDSYNDGTGIVEFSRYEDFKRALRDMDDSKFRSHEGETAYIRVKDPKGSRSPSPYRRSKSRSRSRSRSRSF
jgi:arginine/serine-rich splicing factor 1/9